MSTTQNSTPLLLEKKRLMFVKPSKPTTSCVLSLSTIDNDHTLAFLCHTVSVYRSNLDPSHDTHEFERELSNQKDPTSVIIEALSNALVYYYPLAGKLKRHSDGRLRIHCTADGVPFLEATANWHLSSLNYLDGIEVEISKQLVFDFSSENEEAGRHPLIFQVTKFLCGSFTVGMSLSHSVCDGAGAAQFFQAISEFASGKTEPSVKPVWERERLVGTILKEPMILPMDKAAAAVSPYIPTTSISYKCFNVDAESIERLKLDLMKEIGPGDDPDAGVNESLTFTTVEALGAFVWRSKSRALKLSSGGKTLFCLAVGIRHLMDPPLSVGYYGNAFVGSFAVLIVKDLNEGPLSEVAKFIKLRKKLSFNSEYIKNEINMRETMIQQKIVIEGTGASMLLTDWRHLGLLEDVDFGWKGAINIMPVPWDILGGVDVCLFLPPTKTDPSMKGGVRVLVCLPKAAMPTFKGEMDKLKLIGHQTSS